MPCFPWWPAAALAARGDPDALGILDRAARLPRASATSAWRFPSRTPARSTSSDRRRERARRRRRRGLELVGGMAVALPRRSAGLASLAGGDDPIPGNRRAVSADDRRRWSEAAAQWAARGATYLRAEALAAGDEAAATAALRISTARRNPDRGPAARAVAQAGVRQAPPRPSPVNGGERRRFDAAPTRRAEPGRRGTVQRRDRRPPDALSQDGRPPRLRPAGEARGGQPRASRCGGPPAQPDAIERKVGRTPDAVRRGVFRTVNGMSIYPPSTLGLATRGRRDEQADRRCAGWRPGRVLVAFAVLTALAANQLLVVASFTDRLFAWTIAVRPTSAFLGAAYAAGFVLAIVALRRHSWREVRVALVTVTVFTVLTLIPTLIHLHIFHLSEWRIGCGQLAAWIWLAIYLGVPIACLSVVARQQHTRQRRADRPPDAALAPVGAGRPGDRDVRGGRRDVPGRCQGAPPAGRGDELLAVEAHAAERPDARAPGCSHWPSPRR